MHFQKQVTFFVSFLADVLEIRRMATEGHKKKLRVKMLVWAAVDMQDHTAGASAAP